MELDLIHQTIQNILSANETKSLDSGKWYRKND
jgi:hypothetical protein